jgi:hypothetical protein
MSERPRSASGGGLRAIVLCVGVSLALLALFVSLYPIKGYRVAIGSDTPVYVFWSRYAGVSGIGAVGLGRPATVGTLAALARLLGQPASAVVASLLPAMAVAIALGLGSFVRSALGGDRLRFALVAGFTGSFLSILVGGYASTLAFGAAFVAMLACICEALTRTDRPPMVAAAILLGAAGLAHSLFLALAGALIAGGLIALVPSMRRDMSTGRPFLATGLGRVAAASAGGMALTALGTLATALGPTAGPKLTVDTSRDAVLRRTGLGQSLTDSYQRKLRHDFPWYRALVASGSVLIAVADRDRIEAGLPERVALFWGVMVAWVGLTIVGVLALLVGVRVPGQRLAVFCLAVPALAAVALHRLHRMLAPGRRARVALAGGAVLFVLVGWLGWWSQRPAVGADTITQAGLAGQALAGAPPGTPLILVGDVRAEKPGFAVIRYADYLRGAVPADRVPDVYVFAGSIEDFLAGRPTLTGNREHDLLARAYWAEIEQVLARDPVAVVLESFDRATYRIALELPGSSRLGPGVVALPGSRWRGFSAGQGSSVEEVLSPWHPVWLGPVLLSLIAATGWPWCRLALGSSDRLTRFALCPAFGLAALGLASVAVDAVGLRLAGAGAHVAAGLPLVLGLLLVARSRIRGPGELSGEGRPAGPEPP